MKNIIVAIIYSLIPLISFSQNNECTLKYIFSNKSLVNYQGDIIVNGGVLSKIYNGYYTRFVKPLARGVYTIELINCKTGNIIKKPTKEQLLKYCGECNKKGLEVGILDLTSVKKGAYSFKGVPLYYFGFNDYRVSKINYEDFENYPLARVELYNYASKQNFYTLIEKHPSESKSLHRQFKHSRYIFNNVSLVHELDDNNLVKILASNGVIGVSYSKSSSKEIVALLFGNSQIIHSCSPIKIDIENGNVHYLKSSLTKYYRYPCDFDEKRMSIIYNLQTNIHREAPKNVIEEDFELSHLARFKENNLYGFINSKYEIVIKPQFQKANDFKDGIAMVEKNTVCFFIDTKGNYLKPCPDGFIKNNNKPKPKPITEQMPYFNSSSCANNRNYEEVRKCSEKALLEFMYSNINYPNEARENGIEGIVVVNFTVEKDGSISNVNLVRDIGKGCGSEVIRVLQMTNNKWIPASKNGEPISHIMNLPIRFILGS